MDNRWHTIKCMLGDMETNIHEARAKIHKAYEYRDKCRDMADWLRDMALQHINFNTKGADLVKRHMDALKALPESDPMRNPGKWEAYMERFDDMQPHLAEVKAMIDSFK